LIVNFIIQGAVLPDDWYTCRPHICSLEWTNFY